MPLATSEQLTTYLGTEINPDTAGLLLDGASAAVAGFCGWHIAPVRVDIVVLDGPGTAVLLLPTRRLVALLSVTEDGRPVDLSGVRPAQAGYLTRGQAWTRTPGGLTVTMRHGHHEGPADLAVLVCAVAARAHASPAGVVREQAGGESVQYAQSGNGAAGGVVLLEHEKAALDPYRIPASP